MYIVRWKTDGSYLRAINSNSASWSINKNKAIIFKSPEQFEEYTKINPNCEGSWITQCDIIAVPAVAKMTIESKNKSNNKVYILRSKHNIKNFIKEIFNSWVTYGHMDDAKIFDSPDAAQQYVLANSNSAWNKNEDKCEVERHILSWYTRNCVVQEIHPLNLKK